MCVLRVFTISLLTFETVVWYFLGFFCFFFNVISTFTCTSPERFIELTTVVVKERNCIYLDVYQIPYDHRPPSEPLYVQMSTYCITFVYLLNKCSVLFFVFV